MEKWTCTPVKASRKTQWRRKFFSPEAGTNLGTNYKAIPADTNGTTLNAEPKLTSPTATSIASETVNLGANVVSDGGLTITERGTVWATSANPVYPTDNSGLRLLYNPLDLFAPLNDNRQGLPYPACCHPCTLYQ